MKSKREYCSSFSDLLFDVPEMFQNPGMRRMSNNCFIFSVGSRGMRKFYRMKLMAEKSQFEYLGEANWGFCSEGNKLLTPFDNSGQAHFLSIENASSYPWKSQDEKEDFLRSEKSAQVEKIMLHSFSAD